MKKNPLVSVIIPTRNSENLLESFLRSLSLQSYKNIEQLIVDGNSTDDTIKIARRFNARIISNPRLLADPAVNIGMNNARGDLFMILAIDNIFRDREAIEKIVNIFDNEDIFAVYPKHSSADFDSIYTKYVNRFTDPFNHFVYGYAANARSFNKIYKTIEHNRFFDIYDFNSSKTKPLLALAQGFTVRNNFRRKIVDEWDDCNPILDLVEQNRLMAYAHGVELYHHTIRDLNHFIRKQQWATQNALTAKTYGIAQRQNRLSAQQKLKIKLWPLYTVSVIFPVIQSIIGYVKEKEVIWFYHPIMCIMSFYGSILAIVALVINKDSNINRQ